MASAQDDHDDLGIDQGMAADGDIIDVDGIDEPLSAAPLRGGDYDDIGGEDEEGLSGDEYAPEKKKTPGGMKKIIAPLMVLLLAGGVGSYIVMNPAVLSGLQSAAVGQGDLSARAVAVVPPSVPEASSVPQEMAVADVPPQPLANLNELPPDVVSAPVDVAPEVMPEVVPEVAPEAVSDVVAAETAVVEAPADPLAGVPAGEAVEEGTRQAIMGGDVAVTPEAVSVTPPEVTPEAVGGESVPDAVAQAPADVAPEAVPPETAEAVPESVVPAPDIASVAVVPDTPVSEPTFVPAPPEGTVESPVDAPDVAVAAEPPVMNVQEVGDGTAPEMTPRTIAQVPSEGTGPAAVGGEAASPVAPLPAEDAASVYYDSLSQVPSGAMATSVGPRELNPVLEPASKMIVVNKDKGEGSQESLLVSANRALKLKRYDAALEMFDQLYAKNKRDTRILMGRAVAQQNMGLSESAIQTYEELLALKPDSTEALVNMMGLVRAQYPEVALRRLLDLYSKHPNNAGIAAQIGVTNAELGHFEDALRYLGIAATLEPQNAQHLFNMAIAADRQGSRAEAVRLYERSLEVDAMYGSGGSVPRERIYDRLSILRRS